MGVRQGCWLFQSANSAHMPFAGQKKPSSLIRPSYTIRAAIFEKSVKKDGNKIFKVPYQLLGLKLLLLNAGRQASTGLTPG